MLKQFTTTFFKIIAFFPVMWLFFLYLFAVVAAIRLGHWPVPSLDDPKYLGLGFFYTLAFTGFFLMVIAITAGTSTLIPTLFYKTVPVRYYILFGVSMSLGIIQITEDPFLVIEWFFD